MKKGRKKKEEIAEDYCFICKDGGLLLVCDYKNCLKAYHASCIGKDDSFLETDKRWTCGWHTCSNCNKSSTFQCFCCPNSFCQGCIYGADFVQVKKRTRGFCGYCLKLTTLIEENVDADSDGAKVDFNDTSTYEFLFKDYWEIVKEKEGLTLVDLHAATAFLKSGKNHKTESDLDNLPEEDLISEDDSLEDKCDDEIVIFDDVKVKCRKAKTPLKRSRSKKKTFAGWGSKELLQFLGSVGKNTTQPLTQLDACEIVKDYIHEHNLFHPVKKKIVTSDENLYSLFRKRSLKHHKIYSLLESHFAENDDSDDEYSFSSEDGGDLIGDKRQRRKTSGSKDQKAESYDIKEKVFVSNQKCYAAIIGKNIQCVYLRRSLILKLLDDSETLEHKVIGCFVRVKGDPKDFFYSPQKPYELGQVIGIKKTSQAYKLGDSSIDVVLQISNMFKDIQINMLSDDDFEEEECEDLRQLVKKGLFKRPTVGEFQQKLQIVHEDITNHAIDKEILKLQKQIDRANVNGWRRERFECIDRRNLLRTPAERLRLLKEMPKVVADREEDTVAISGVVNLREDTKVMAPGMKRCVRRESSVQEVDTSPSTGPIQAEMSVPVDRMDTHDPDVKRDTPFDASSAEAHVSSSTRRPRGPSVGKGTRALVEKMGKLPISVHPVYGRPVDPVQSAKLSSFVGTYVRREMHLRPTFADGGKDAISEGLEKAQAFFSVDPVDYPHLRSCFEAILKNRTKDMRYKAHKWWEQNQPPEVARTKPAKHFTQEDWDVLCTYWEDPRTQERCAKNKANRASLKWGHTTGSRSFVAHRHTLCDEEKRTERDPIDFFRDTRCKDGVWVNQAAEETHAQMEELRQKNTQEDGTQAMPSAQIVEDVLGYRAGYVKGLGYGPKPTSSGSTMRSTGRTSMDNEIQGKLDELAAKNEELAAKNEKLEEKSMRYEHQISELHTFLGTICARQGWDAPPFIRGTGPRTSSTSSQLHDPSSHQPSGC